MVWMIEVKDLAKTIGAVEIVRGISLTVAKGSVFGFLGPNGAGKTTTMKILVGLNKPTSGTARIDGKDADDTITHTKIGFMPEAAYFYEYLTGFEFLRFCGELFDGASRDEKHYDDILRSVGLYDARNRTIRTYSKGMRQRLGFAQALVNDPEYIFLDEPLDGLDPIGRRELKQMIIALKKKGKTIFFNSHILSDTEEICDNIGILHKGNLVYCGSVKDFVKGRTLEEQFVTTIEAL